MNLIVHQFKTDWRHFRGGLLGLWGLYALQLLLAASFVGGDAEESLQPVLLFVQIFAGGFLLARLVQADALVGGEAQWLTRPVRRFHLYWAKTAFILAFVVFPRLMPQMILDACHHYSFGLFVASVAGLLLFTLVIVFFVAAVAALTPDLPRFFLAVGGFLGGCLIWTMVLSVRFAHTPGHAPSYYASAVAAGLWFFLAVAALVWTWQVLGGRAVAGYCALAVGVLVLPWMMFAWPRDFLRPEPVPIPPPPISSLNDTADDTNGQPLWGQFVISGLTARSMVVAQNVSANFKPKEQAKAYSLPSFRPMMVVNRGGALGGDRLTFDRVLPMDSPQQADFMAVIRSFFPAETLWNGEPDNSWNNWGGFPDVSGIMKKDTNRPAMGGFHADAEMDEFKVVPAAQVPLRPGTWNLAPGERLSIRGLKPQPGGLELNLEIYRATPLLSADRYRFAARSGMMHSFYTLVLYNPEWGEADILNNNFSYAMPVTLLGETREVVRFTLPLPVLQQRLAGVSLQEFLGKARLWVFQPEYAGTFKESIQQNDFNLSEVQTWSSHQTANTKDELDIQRAVLPRSPTSAQLGGYLDTIFQHLPEFYSEPGRKKVVAKLEAIGSNGLPALLARLPMDPQNETAYVFPMLTKLATREQLPDLQAALARDPNLADWFENQRWSDDARPVILRTLGNHRLSFPGSALRIAAEARDPASYPDLAWHFERLDWGQAEVAKALSRCPGFDLPAAVQAAWERVRLGLNQPGDLALVAARQGLPDAFNQAVVWLEQSRNDPRYDQRQAMELAAMTSFKGQPAEAVGWLSANLGGFTYNSVSHRYLLPGETAVQ